MRIFKRKQPKKTHQEWIDLIKEFKANYGRLPKPQEKYQGQSIGQTYNWLKRQQLAGKLPAQETKQLEKLGVNWIKKHKSSAEWVELILLFHKKYNRPPNKTEDFAGEHIGTACNTLRLKKRAGKLEPVLIKKLNAIGFIWQAKTKTDEEWCELFAEKLQKKDTALKTPYYQQAANRLRRKKAAKKLKKQLVKKLEKAGFNWQPRPAAKEAAENERQELKKQTGTPGERIKLLQEFYFEYGFFPKNNKEVFKGQRVGRTALYFRQRYQEGKLPPEIIDRLNKINFHWQTPRREVLFLEWAGLLKEFYDINRKMPQKNEYFKGFNLGNIFRQLNQYKPSSLPQNVIDILRQTGFVVNPWRKIKTPREIMALLKEFNALYGRKPRSSEYFKDYNLGRGYWYLKEQFLANKLPADLRAEVEGLLES